MVGHVREGLATDACTEGEGGFPLRWTVSPQAGVLGSAQEEGSSLGQERNRGLRPAGRCREAGGNARPAARRRKIRPRSGMIRLLRLLPCSSLGIIACRHIAIGVSRVDDLPPAMPLLPSARRMAVSIRVRGSMGESRGTGEVRPAGVERGGSSAHAWRPRPSGS